MNKRMKALQDKVLAEAYEKQQGMDWVMEKFAELIIKECVGKLKETKHVKAELPFLQSADIKTIQELPLSVYITDLLEHFGVEE